MSDEPDNKTPPSPAAATGRISRDRNRQSRRRMLRTLLLSSGVLSAALAGYLPIIYRRPHRLRPPGALDEKDFLSSCIKCGQCVQVCPVQAIRLADIGDGFGLGVPYIEPREQACDFSCDAVQCILACPTGSLTYDKPNFLSARPGAKLANKPVLLAKENDPEPTLNMSERIGLARLRHANTCLAAQGQGFSGLARGASFKGRLRYSEVDRWNPIPVSDHPYDVDECDLCVQACPIRGAISIETVRDADGQSQRQPVIHEPCVGCGACEMICPVEPACITIDVWGEWPV